jgi:hypothetical protein
MKVYYKKHQREQYEVIAICDEDVLGKSLGTQSISENFYKGQLISLTRAIDILKSANNFNIAGKVIVDACIKQGIVSDQGILIFNGIPLAMKLHL